MRPFGWTTRPLGRRHPMLQQSFETAQPINRPSLHHKIEDRKVYKLHLAKRLRLNHSQADKIDDLRSLTIPPGRFRPLLLQQRLIGTPRS